MPQITLDLVSLDGKPLLGLSRQFEGRGGTIGRDEANTLVLPDSHRRVSRLHAAISFPDGVPTITNSSAVLPIGVGGMQLECGQALPLVRGMSLEIGPYVLAVRPSELDDQAMPVGAALTPAAPHFAGGSGPAVEPLTDAPAPAGDDPFADLLSGFGPGPLAASVPMSYSPGHQVDDPLGMFGSSPGSASDSSFGESGWKTDPYAGLGLGTDTGAGPLRKAEPHPWPSSAPPAQAVIPEDFNPFDMPSASARNSADPLAALLGGAAAPAEGMLIKAEDSIDALFAPAGGPMGDGFLGGGMSVGGLLGETPGAAHSLLAQSENSDPLALFGSPPAVDEGHGQPMRDDLAELGGAYLPPRAIDPLFGFAPAASSPQSSAPARGSPPQAAAMPSYPQDALTRAFLTGANLQPSALPQGLTPEIMSLIGSLLHHATTGAIEMLAIRANIKREVQANVTIISSHANNPLKFLPDATTVLQQFLGKKMPGFMRPDEAMRDAFGDLRAHEVGVIAGTRAALAEVLGRFDPEILGDRLIGGSLLEKAVPAVRKTKLWDLYLQRYAQIRLEVEDDFQSVFGKAFVEAYERETARMRAADGSR